MRDTSAVLDSVVITTLTLEALVYDRMRVNQPLEFTPRIMFTVVVHVLFPLSGEKDKSRNNIDQWTQ